jgi:hypothetical protein
MGGSGMNVVAADADNPRNKHQYILVKTIGVGTWLAVEKDTTRYVRLVNRPGQWLNYGKVDPKQYEDD